MSTTPTAARTPTLRTATPDDRAAIERLLTATGLPTTGIADLLATRSADFFVAEEHETGELVAVAGLEVCCDDALLRSVAVRPEWQQHGLGRDLIRHVVCVAEGRGLRALYLLTMTAEHYFPRFGFERIERRAVPADIAETLEFKSACPASATVMVRPLSPVSAGADA